MFIVTFFLMFIYTEQNVNVDKKILNAGYQLYFRIKQMSKQNEKSNIQLVHDNEKKLILRTAL